MSPREFGEAWALSQLSPGIHLVALAGLIGRRVPVGAASRPRLAE